MKKIFVLVLVFLLITPVLNANALSVSAKSAIVINADTGEVIWSHNATERLPMASTTKIMTGLLLCESGDLEREITVTAEMLRVEGSSMGLLAGDRVTLHDLLYGLMLASGNDAANVIAFTLGNTVDGFVQMMNEKAKALGLRNTEFETPSGLDGDRHFTTAADLAELTRIALQNPVFAKAVSTSSAVLNYGNPPYKRTVTNHNKLLKNFDGAIGVKTGFTKKAGRCLVSAAQRDGKTVIAVTLNAPDDWNDHRNMLEYGLRSVQPIELKTDRDCYNIPVIGSKEIINIEVEPFAINVLDNTGFDVKVYLPQFVYAPIKADEPLGRVEYLKDGKVMRTEMICAEADIAANTLKPDFTHAFFEIFKMIFINIWEK